MPRTVSPMPDQAGDFCLMHRVDHRGRGAGPAEHVTNVDNVGDAGPFSAEFVRHHDAQQALRPRGSDSLLRKSRLVIDRLGIGRSDAGYDIRLGGTAQKVLRRVELLARIHD